MLGNVHEKTIYSKKKDGKKKKKKACEAVLVLACRAEPRICPVTSLATPRMAPIRAQVRVKLPHGVDISSFCMRDHPRHCFFLLEVAD